MKIIELDLTGCTHQIDIQKRIKEAFDFPDWYGHNWDAFDDLLWSEIDEVKVVLKGIRSLPASLDKTLAIMYKILDKKVDNANKFNEEFSYETLN